MTDLLSSEFIIPTCFTDAVIQVQDVKFPIHKIIMCKCSSIFRCVRTEVQMCVISHMLPYNITMTMNSVFCDSLPKEKTLHSFSTTELCSYAGPDRRKGTLLLWNCPQL